MREFKIAKGAEVISVSYRKGVSRAMDSKVIKEDVSYSTEDILADPVGHLGYDKNHQSISGQFARAGFYEIKLPENTSGYDSMLVHKDDVVYVVN